MNHMHASRWDHAVARPVLWGGIGLMFSAAGIAYIGTQLRNALKEHERCMA